MSTDAISQESFSFYVPYATNTVLNVPNGVGETALLYTQGSGLTNDYEESSVYRQKFDGAPNILSTIDVTNELENYGSLNNKKNVKN